MNGTDLQPDRSLHCSNTAKSHTSRRSSKEKKAQLALERLEEKTLNLKLLNDQAKLDKDFLNKKYEIL